MSRNIDWGAIRLAYETGEKVSAIAKRHGVASSGIYIKANRQGWQKKGAQDVNELAECKLYGLDTAPTQADKEQALEDAAAELAEVKRRQRDEWNKGQYVKELKQAVKDNDKDRVLVLKNAIDAQKAAQEGERKAWGITDKPTAEVSGVLEVRWEG